MRKQVKKGRETHLLCPTRLTVPARYSVLKVVAVVRGRYGGGSKFGDDGGKFEGGWDGIESGGSRSKEAGLLLGRFVPGSFHILSSILAVASAAGSRVSSPPLLQLIRKFLSHGSNCAKEIEKFRKIK